MNNKGTKALTWVDINHMITEYLISAQEFAWRVQPKQVAKMGVKLKSNLSSERGDVPGWVLVVLMTTGLVTAIWTIAAPRLSAILKNSLDAMNGIR
jgi:hypothetical protein